MRSSQTECPQRFTNVALRPEFESSPNNAKAILYFPFSRVPYQRPFVPRRRSRCSTSTVPTKPTSANADHWTA